MRKPIIITGTDTDVGKTIFAAALMLGLEESNAAPHYWKPIQCGITDTVDTKRVQKMTGLPQERFLPEKHIFSQPLSPHRAAELDNTPIEMESLEKKSNLPEVNGTLIIEGAGGLMVPLTRRNLQINLYKKWKIPVVLCARTGLGTINHTLLSLEAIWARRIPLKGIAFIGEENEDNMTTIKQFSNVKILGRLPMLDVNNPQNLKTAFMENFKVEDFS